MAQQHGLVLVMLVYQDLQDLVDHQVLLEQVPLAHQDPQVQVAQQVLVVVVHQGQVALLDHQAHLALQELALLVFQVPQDPLVQQDQEAVDHQVLAGRQVLPVLAQLELQDLLVRQGLVVPLALERQGLQDPVALLAHLGQELLVQQVLQVLVVQVDLQELVQVVPQDPLVLQDRQELVQLGHQDQVGHLVPQVLVVLVIHLGRLDHQVLAVLVEQVRQDLQGLVGRLALVLLDHQARQELPQLVRYS